MMKKRTLGKSGLEVSALGLGCMSGGQFTLPDFVSHIRIAPDGRAHIAVNLPATSISGGGSYSGTDSMTVKLNRKRTQLTGVWQMHLYYTFADGTPDQCESGPVRFTDAN